MSTAVQVLAIVSMQVPVKWTERRRIIIKKRKKKKPVEISS